MAGLLVTLMLIGIIFVTVTLTGAMVWFLHNHSCLRYR